MGKTNPLLIAVSVSFLLIISSSSSKFDDSRDADALVAFRNTITSDPHGISAQNWSGSNASSVCRWIGVSCSANHRFNGPTHRLGDIVRFGPTAPRGFVFPMEKASARGGFNTLYKVSRSPLLPDVGCQNRRVLNFSGFGFQASLDHLPNLTFLTSLVLHNNSFTGIIPNRLSNLRRLQLLDLGSNGLTGQIPPSIFNISSLVKLDLSNNSLSGSLPEDICNGVSMLSELHLHRNQLSGEIPLDIYKCRKVEVLSLSINLFNGSIPESIGRMTNLRDLWLGVNDFHGTIPTEIGNLTQLRVLSLPDSSLTGQIPPSIFNISSIERLDLSNNSLSGSLPLVMCRNLPNLEDLYVSENQLTGPVLDTMLECTKLSILVISTNNFKGNMPKDIGNLTALTVLHIRYNDFTGNIPKHIANLTALQALNLGINHFTGELPEELGNLDLVEIIVWKNKFYGTIPSSLFNISTLEAIEFSENHFSGQLPMSFGVSLPSLQKLGLSGNKLSGRIPRFIGNASSLTVIDINSNSFTGPVPNFGGLRLLQYLEIAENNLTGESPNQELSFLSSLTNCPQLYSMEVSLNQLDGTLPSTIGNFSTSLKVFSAFGCRIKGSIPSEIGNLTALNDLYLDSNEFSGSIPTTLGKLEQLDRVYLEYNNLEGYLPTDICKLGKLGDFYVSSNALYGQIPPCIGELKFLQRLYLDSNNFNSTLPLSLWSLKDLLFLNLSSNMLTGSLPFEIGNLKVVEDLDLSNNQFSGDIPSSIAKADSLINLCLAQNTFQGPLPDSLVSLKGIVSLDLSFNNFSGAIPNALEELRYLQYFNVSYNRLEGQIPTSGVFANFTAESFMNNDALCGAPRLHFPPCREQQKKTRFKNSLSLVKYILPPCLLVAVLLIVILLLSRKRKLSTGPTEPEITSHILKRRSHRELGQATNDFNESNLLGEGSFGSVYIGTLDDGTTAAIKVFNLHSDKASNSFETELEVLTDIRHKNLIKVISYCNSEAFKALVLEYMPHGSLDKWLYSHNYFLDLLQRLNIAIDVAFALQHLHLGHTFPIVHCDLKPSNVMLEKDMTAHVGDFGIAKLFHEGESVAQTGTLATIGYMAPEHGAQGMVSTCSDVYSFGIILLELCTRKKPTDTMFADEMSLKSWVNLSLCKNEITEVVDINLFEREDHNFSAKEQCISSMLRLAMECLPVSPSDRIDISSAVAKLVQIRTVFVGTTRDLTSRRA